MTDPNVIEALETIVSKLWDIQIPILVIVAGIVYLALTLTAIEKKIK